MNQTIETLDINGTRYVRADSLPNAVPNGNRAIVVVDRGWIFAGDVTEEEGRIYLDRAVHVFSWQTGGFAKMIADPSGAGAKLIKLALRVDIPSGAEVFRVPVSESWGL